MKRNTSKALTTKAKPQLVPYDRVLSEMIDLLENARRASARAVNAIMTATYWEIGRRIVEVEQGGEHRAGYGKELLQKFSADLQSRFRKGFSVDNLESMRKFYITWPPVKISDTVSRKSGDDPKSETASRIFTLDDIAKSFPLSWSHYVALLGVNDEKGREFYEAEALRGGWSVRQLNRQIDTQFYQRVLLSKNKAAMLTKGAASKPEDAVTPEEEIKSPFVLEFLGLKDEYSESELEEALIKHLEKFLLELGGDFTFVGRQKRLRIDDQWYRIDLVFYHRQLRCLVLIDLKLKKLTAGDVGQMHVYCNYAKDQWTLPDENPPIGLILCAGKGVTLARYALEGLPNKIMASDYLTALPDKALLEAELERTRLTLESYKQTAKQQRTSKPVKVKKR